MKIEPGSTGSGGGGGGMNTNASNATAAAFGNLVAGSGIATARHALGLDTIDSPTFTALRLTGTTDSSSITTGTLIVAGGLGLGKSLYTLYGNLVGNGSTFSELDVIASDNSQTMLGKLTGGAGYVGSLTNQDFGIWSNNVLRLGFQNVGGMALTTAGALPTGGYKGDGTFNTPAGAIYDANVAPTGTGAYVHATSPTLVTPALGSATATSINKLTLTQPATGSALTIADGKTLTDTSAVGALALKGATGGGFAQAACADLSNGATGCSTATGTNGATIPLLNGTNTFSGAQTFGQTLGTMNPQTGTTYTIAQADCGTLVKVSNAGAITVTAPSTITGVCHVAVMQGGAGQITVAAGASATLASAHSYTKTAAQWAVISLSNVGATAADWILAGDGA